MKITELAKEIEITEEEIKSEVIERTFPIDTYFEHTYFISTEEDADQYFIRRGKNWTWKGPGYYDYDGYMGSEDEHVVSVLRIADGEIVGASYSTDNFRNKTAGDSLEDDVDGVVDLWIETFEI
ncbi:MAG TPA: hypothetical protein VK982_09650 [Bacteroidales bacterium]|nr:hypothetical protein [Bacteroidales bacterium]